MRKNWPHLSNHRQKNIVTVSTWTCIRSCLLILLLIKSCIIKLRHKIHKNSHYKIFRMLNKWLTIKLINWCPINNSMITKMSSMKSRRSVREIVNLNKLNLLKSDLKIKKDTKKSPIKIKFKSNSINLITNSKTKNSSDFIFFYSFFFFKISEILTLKRLFKISYKKKILS